MAHLELGALIKNVQITAAGFGGACAVFNGTYLLTFCGKAPVYFMTDTCAYLKKFDDGSYVVAAWQQGSPQIKIVFFNPGGTALATYGYPQCGVTNYNATKISATCTAPNTISFSTLPSSGPGVCDCFANLPLPTTLHLTITNSTCADMPNGTYTMPFDATNDRDPVYEVQVGNMVFDFYPPPNDGAAPNCAKITLAPFCASPFATCDHDNDGDGESATTCSCSPFTASGHYIVKFACCTCIVNDSFDWSIAP